MAESAADIDSYGVSKNEAYERSPIHGSQKATPGLINHPSFRINAEDMQDSPIADMGEGFQGSNLVACSGFFVPHITVGSALR